MSNLTYPRPCKKCHADVKNDEDYKKHNEKFHKWSFRWAKLLQGEIK